jgi:cellulose biosynthesis protein BcsQ
MDWVHWIASELDRRWRNSGRVVRAVLVLVATVLIALGLWLFPIIRNIVNHFSDAGPAAQSLVLLVMLVWFAVLVWFATNRANRVEELKDAKAQADTRREAAEQEAAQLQERWDDLLAVECRDVLWRRPCHDPPAEFVPRLNRTTRFLTVLNLKGGVGKTTLTGNLAASLAAGDPPLRVLMIDVDFQGTLGGSAADEAAIRLQHQNASLVNLLLETSPADPGLVRRLAVPMTGADRARVVLANDSLDPTEFHLQARYLLEPGADPRFRFRSHLHHPDVFAAYDLVVFDCPPRVTTSVVNAVACSDYVLIPTKLDDGSIDAVPRTDAWVKSLGAVCQAEAVWVVASHATVRVGKPVKADQESYAKLKDRVESSCGAGRLFGAVVPATKDALPPERGRVAGTADAGRAVYAGVAAELRKRMGI